MTGKGSHLRCDCAMSIKVAFFDTLGVPRFSPSGQPISLEVFPYVRDVLARLQQEGLRLGVISNTGTISTLPGVRLGLGSRR
jgi:phosphoglycolate phosphatase-like HAD superfamily hydrolase